MQSAQITRILCPLPDAKRPSRVSQIGDLVPDARGGVLSEEQCLKESRGTGTRCCAISKPVSWQKGGQRDQRRKRVAAAAVVRTNGLWTTTPPFAHAGRPLDVTRWKVGRIAPRVKSCEDTRSTTELSNRSRDVPQICKGARTSSGRRRRNRQIEAASVPYSNDGFVQGVQHHHGSQLLAAVMDRWPPNSRFGSRKHSRFHRGFNGWRKFTHARTR